MKIYILLFFALISARLYGQETLKGRVFSANDGLPVGGAVVTIHNGLKSTETDRDGRFQMVINADSVMLRISHLGYDQKALWVRIPYNGALEVYLTASVQALETITIVSTGYQKIPKERSTGSFSTVNKELFNHQTGTDILSRLPALAGSLVTDNGRGGTPQLMLRGLSTISGPKDPLIVIDDFPYDGDITNINPNMVESITLLKDASASSIWGAKAANGVIVITTTSGRYGQPVGVEFNTNVTIGDKPDLYYIPQISSSDFIDAETELFKKGFYNSTLNAANHPVISPVVDLLNKAQKGIISQEQAQDKIDQLKTVDVRNQFDKYLYRHSVNQQYFLSARGGSRNFSWNSSAGYDSNRETLGSTYQRINLRFQNSYRPVKSLTLTTGLYYTQTQNGSGRYGYGNVAMKGNSFVPYMEMADENGKPLPVSRNLNPNYIATAGNGLLPDWKYYPLTDWEHVKAERSGMDILGTTALSFEVFKGLSVRLNYQYERQINYNTNLADQESFSSRSYVNQFAQIVNGQVNFIVPQGGILDKSHTLLTANNVRSQLNFNKTYNRHNISAISGMEIRSNATTASQERYYGYNPENLTTANVDYTRTYPQFVGGSSAFIYNGQSLRQSATRFVSYFGNAAYTYNKRYILSVSARKDASNLFGLNTNDQWNPFWSAGTTWKLSEEKFYTSEILPYLGMRITYGFSGNIDPGMVAVNTISFLPGVSVFTGLPMAQISNYYNPNLKWETSRMLNIGIDFSLKNDRVTGSVEYYTKKGENLFGVSSTDYSTGIPPSVLRNVASMKGAGWDVELRSLNTGRIIKWQSIFNLSGYKDKVEEYLINRTLARQYVTSGVPISGVKGHPVYSIYAYKWAGLDPATGEAQGYLEGNVSKAYSSITGTGTKVEDLDFFGSALPTVFGSLINSFQWKNTSLQVGLSFKSGYWFRRSSINYTELFNNWQGHSDYTLRWQKPGDESLTQVPVNPFTANAQRDIFYTGSSALIEKADHVRFQYLRLAYDIRLPKGIDKLQAYINVSSLGLLWRANKAGIDPDFNIGAGGSTVAPAQYTLGIRTKL